ncbi:uncharacterized protein [Apostichopus japonicus]|uniref:uncharacterized protein n=1 Tax=Stichopus japonicus TaxID=307972 RepID=UPI003AB2AFCE
MSTFHITFKEQKQVFEVQDISTLKEKVRSEFHIDEDIRFQLYDKTWDDWVDVEIHQLPQRGKIQIITIPHEDTLPINLTDLSSTNSLFSESYNFSDAPIQIEPPTKNFISSMIQLAHQKESCQSTSQAEDISSASTSSSHSWNVEEDCSTGESDVKRKWLEMKQWPDKFALPRLPVVLEGKLNAERMPNDRERRQIVQTLFDYMAGFTSYPLSAHYSEAVRCLLEKYPFLGKETIPGARPVEYWRMKIMDKFRNERKHMPVEKKRKSSGVTPAKAVDDQQLVDDTASIQRHKKWMQEEARRARQNEVKISQMMEITFQSRRKWIIDEKPTVAELKREFPCLFSQRQILIEMRRITPSIDACHAKDLLMSNLEAYAKYLIDSCQSKKNAKAIVNNYREAIANLKQHFALGRFFPPF